MITVSQISSLAPLSTRLACFFCRASRLMSTQSPILPVASPPTEFTLPIRTSKLSLSPPSSTSDSTPVDYIAIRHKGRAVLPPPVTDQISYSLDGPLRRVAPYYWTYHTYAKGRWLGRTLLDVFTSEMRDRSPEYYSAAINAGSISVNGQPGTHDTILNNNDLISHRLHRHEPPVSSQPVGIVCETDDLLVINKPAGVPVHPTGRYQFNSVTEIVRIMFNDAFVPRPCNRLDRLTSGVMFVGKTSEGAERFTQQLRTKAIRKEYIARVIGEFPTETVVCGQPVLQISPKVGLNAVRANGKEARTIFKRIAYYPPTIPQTPSPPSSTSTSTSTKSSTPNANLPWSSHKGYSIVRCFPLTGRTHQIRVHLQHLGHPIANDPIYANTSVFGPALWSSTASPADLPGDETVLARLERMGKQDAASAVAYLDASGAAYEAARAERLNGDACATCGADLYSDPGVHELGIFLHARRYEAADGAWRYETGLPVWARPGTQGGCGGAGVGCHDGGSVESGGLGRETDLTAEEWNVQMVELEKSVVPRGSRGLVLGKTTGNVKSATFASIE